MKEKVKDRFKKIKKGVKAIVVILLGGILSIFLISFLAIFIRKKNKTKKK